MTEGRHKTIYLDSIQDDHQFEIPVLGRVKMSAPSLNDLELAFQRVSETTENKGEVFVRVLLTQNLKEPSLAEEQIEGLDDEAWAALCTAIAEASGLSEKLEETDEILPIAERVYLAYEMWLRELSESIVAALTETRSKIIESIGRSPLMALREAFTPLENVGLAGLGFSSLFETIEAVEYGGLSKALEAIARGTAASIARSVEQFHDRISSLADTGRVFFDRLLRELELNAQEVEPVFREAGFWLTLAMPLGILREAKRLSDTDELSPETLRQTILDYFRIDSGRNLQEMVRRWDNHPEFACRMHIIEDALGAHLEYKYTLSVAAVIPHVEAIAGYITRITPGRNARRMMERLRHEFQTDTSALRFVRGHIIAEVINEMYLLHIDFANFNTELQRLGISGDHLLHRHAILHGVHVNYNTEENSLRAFLLLEELYQLCRLMEEQRNGD